MQRSRYNYLLAKDDRSSDQQEQFLELKQKFLDHQQQDSLLSLLDQDQKFQQDQQFIQIQQQKKKERTFTLDCLAETKTITIPTFELDSIADIKFRIILASGTFSSFIFFKENFLKLDKFLNLYQLFLEIKQVKAPIRRPTMGKKLVPKVPVVAGAVEGAIPVVSPLIAMYQCAKSYGVKIFLFLKLYITFRMLEKFPFLMKRTVDITENQKRVLDQLQILLQTEIDNIPDLSIFGDSVIDDENRKRVDKKYMKQIWTKEWLTTEIKNFINKKATLVKSTESWTTLAMSYETLTVIPIYDEKIVGKVESFKTTTEDTTGILFDKLILNADYPIAKYKQFYKIYLVDQGFTSTQNEEIAIDNLECLRILDKDGRLCFYIENKPKGIQIQCVLENESIISSREMLIDFLKIEKQRIQAPISMGIVAEFTMNLKIHPFDSSIFSNLCMNHPLFFKFFKVNDTDKISRGKSVFLYFHDYGKRHEKANEEIHVGGWNKIISRFGDLTAILSPVTKKDKFTIYIKVIRSATLEMVRIFQRVLGKLVYLYEKVFNDQVIIFKKLYPSFKPFITPIEKDPSLSGVKSLSSKIFHGGFSRSCQFPKAPIVLSENTAITKTIDKKLLFPPVEFRDFKPTWYGCPHPEFPYPGLITVNKKGHPFGYAPCCYTKSYVEDNIEKSKNIEFFIQHGYFEYFDKPIIFKTEKKATPLNTIYRIANFIGQEGPLPEKLEQFMNLLEPSLKFTRVGTNRWKYDSLVGCLEYRYSKISKKDSMRSPRELREKILQSTLEVGMQQNFDIGVEGIIQILQDPNIGIEATRFIRILEEFYNINIFVFTQHIDDKERKTDILRPKNYKEYYYTFWSLIKKRPIVFLIEYPEIFKYELIISREGFADVEYDLDCYPEYKKLLLHTFGSFSGQMPVVIPDDFKFKNLISHQIFDCYGKTRIFILEDQFPVLIQKPVAPFNKPSYLGELPMPKYSKVKEYLDSKGVVIKEIFNYRQNIVLVVDDFALLFFLCSSRGQQDLLSGQNISSLTKSKDTDILEIVDLLKNNGKNLIMTKNNIRLVNAIKDFCLFYFSIFMKDLLPKITLFNIGTSITQFFENMVQFVPMSELPYNTIEQIHPRLSLNPNIYKDGKLLLPSNLERKLFYFLQWFSVTKTNLFLDYKDITEIPSYFSYVSDFNYQPEHIIQTTLLSFHNFSSQRFSKIPLTNLIKPLNQLFFYYNPSETFENKPYLAYITTDFKFGCRISTYFNTTHSINVPENFVTVSAFYERKGNSKSWNKKGSGDAKFYVYHGKNVYIFLLNFKQ